MFWFAGTRVEKIRHLTTVFQGFAQMDPMTRQKTNARFICKQNTPK
jgi:hypothetical protein